MKMAAKTLISCLWFDTQAEQAAQHYVSIFENSRLGGTSRYTAEGEKIHGKPAGSVMTVEFEIGSNKFVALNGGPMFKFNEAVSFQILCDTQEEIDYFSARLGEGGEQGPCGWLKDKFGLSWQVTPVALIQMLKNRDTAKGQRAMKAMLQMKKLDLAALQKGLRRLNVTIHPPHRSFKGESHGSHPVPVPRRPRRRGDRVLQEERSAPRSA